MELVNESGTKWRYQIINHGTEEEPLLAVHELYYDINTNRIKGYTEFPIRLTQFDSPDELPITFQRILKDLNDFGVIPIAELEAIFSKRKENK